MPFAAAVRFGNVYVELFRDVPLLVQMFLWYFVVPEIVPHAFGTWLKQLPNASFYTAVVALGLYMSARVAEQVRAGILSLPRGQRQAALALGLTLPQTYAYVLMPMTYRIIMPPLTSEPVSYTHLPTDGLMWDESARPAMRRRIGAACRRG